MLDHIRLSWFPYSDLMFRLLSHNSLLRLSIHASLSCLLKAPFPSFLLRYHYCHVLLADSILLFWLLSHVQNVESCSPRPVEDCIVSIFLRPLLDYVLVFHLLNLFSLLGHIPLLWFSSWVLIVGVWSHVMIVELRFPDLFAMLYHQINL